MTPSLAGRALALSLWAALAHAQGSEENTKGLAELGQAAQQASEACGVKLAASYDWKSEAPSPGKPGWQGPVYCKEVVEALRDACHDAVGKAVLGETFKAVRCRFEPGASKRKELPAGGGAVLVRSGEVLEVSYDWASSNLSSEAYTWLTRRLRTPWPNGEATITARQEKAQGEKEFAEAIDAFARECGQRLEVSYDWNSEKASPASPAWQGFMYCKNVLTGLQTVCSDADAKAIFFENVKALRCRFQEGASKHKELAEGGGAWLQLGKGELSAEYEWTSPNLDNEAYRWAMKRMPTPGDNGPATIEARKERKRGEKDLADAVEAFNGRCAAKLEATYDFASEKASPAKPAWQGYLYCKGVLDGVASACEQNPKVKARVQKLKAIGCRYEKGADKSKKLRAGGGAVLEHKGARLQVSYDWGSGNLESEAMRGIDKAL